MSNTPFPFNPVDSAIAVMYQNEGMIADRVMPRVPVAKSTFRYPVYSLKQGFIIADDDKVGRKSKPNEIEFSSTEATASTEDYGYDSKIPQSDITDAAGEKFNPVASAIRGIMDYVKRKREKRVADIVFGYANYGTSNRRTLTGTDQFTDYTNSKPDEVIFDALEAMVMRPNVMVISQLGWRYLSMHPRIVKGFHANSGDMGKASLQYIADFFEIDEIIVGKAWVDTAKKGQAASLSRCWGKHIALLNVNKRVESINDGITFGVTAQLGQAVAGSMPDPDIGLRGGLVVRAGESLAEIVTANDLGYMIKDAFA